MQPTSDSMAFSGFGIMRRDFKHIAKRGEATSALAVAEVTGEYKPEGRLQAEVPRAAQRRRDSGPGNAGPDRLRLPRGCAGRAPDRLINDVASLSCNKTGNVFQGRKCSQMFPVVCKTNCVQEPAGASGGDRGRSRRRVGRGLFQASWKRAHYTPSAAGSFSLPSEDWSAGVCDDLQRQVGLAQHL